MDRAKNMQTRAINTAYIRFHSGTKHFDFKYNNIGTSVVNTSKTLPPDSDIIPDVLGKMQTNDAQAPNMDIRSTTLFQHNPMK